MLKRYIWILLSGWLTPTTLVFGEGWGLHSGPQKSNQWLLTTDVTLIPQTAFLWWFPPPTVMIQQSAHSKLFELTMRYINFSGFAWFVSLTALALKNAQNQSVADMFHSNEWHIPIGSDRKSGGWGGCWVSCNACMLGKHRSVVRFFSHYSIIPSPHHFLCFVSIR